MASTAKHRTQINLERYQYEYLARSAGRTGRSISSLLRELVDREMGAGASVAEDPALYLGSEPIQGGPSDVSVEHDRYIYRVDKP